MSCMGMNKEYFILKRLFQKLNYVKKIMILYIILDVILPLLIIVIYSNEKYL